MPPPPVATPPEMRMLHLSTHEVSGDPAGSISVNWTSDIGFYIRAELHSLMYI